MRDIKRVNINGKTEIKFVMTSDIFMIKNFTGDDIYVSFKEDASEENWSKILDRVCERYDMESEYNSVWVKGSGEIEVQLL